MACPYKGCNRLRLGSGRPDADALNQLKRKALMQQKLRLLVLLHLGRPEVRCCDRIPVELIQLIQPRAERGVVGSRIGKRERPARAVRRRPRDDRV